MPLVLILIAAMLPMVPTRIAAQETDHLPAHHNSVVIAAANAGLGAITAAVGSGVRNKPMRASAVVRGAFGGLMVFAGKATVAENKWYATLLGRQLAAVGSSGVRNSAAGRGFTEQLLLPWGPLRAHVDTKRRVKVRLKLDLMGTAAMAVGLAHDDLELDMERSLLYGAVVLKRDGWPAGDRAVGSHVGGVVKYRLRTIDGPTSQSEIDRIIGHEMVHVAQADFMFSAWSEPLEAYLLRGGEAGKVIGRFVDLSLNVPASAALNGLVPYRHRPWEREAVSLAGER